MKINMDIISSDYNVLHSGVLLLFDAQSDLRFDFSTDDDFSFSVVLKFESNGSEKSNNLQATAKGNEIVFLCTNFDNPLGTGTTSPIEIATVNDKKLYLHFWVYLLSKTTRKVEYTVFEEQ